MKKHHIYILLIAIVLFNVVVFDFGLFRPKSRKSSEQRISDSQKIPVNFDYGSWNGSTYKNDFFGFSITVPEGWYISGDDEMKALMKQGIEAMDEGGIGNQNEMKRLGEMVEITNVNLFFAARHSFEQAMEQELSNPVISVAVENLGKFANQVDLPRYVNITRQNLAKAIPGVIIKPQTNKLIDGQEFTSVQFQFSIEGIPITQENLICLKNGYAMSFALTFDDDSEKEQLYAIMATLKWQ